MSDIPVPAAARDWRLGAVLLAAWAVWAALRHIGYWAPDLSALYFAGRFYGLGEFDMVYASPARFFGEDYPARWAAEAVALGYPDAAIFPYIYPPLWAALAAPFAVRSDPVAFFGAIYAVQIAMLAAAPVLTWRILRPSMPQTVWAAASVLLLSTALIAELSLFHNQPHIAVSVLILLAFERMSSGRQVACGVALGLAAAIKLTPILLVALLLVERQYRAALTAVAVAGALALASLAVAGPDLHATYLAKLRVLAEQLVIWNSNYSLKSVLYQLSEILAGRGLVAGEDIRVLLATAPGWLGPMVLALLAAGTVLLVVATSKLPFRERLTRRLAGGYLLLTLCGPLAWAHHYLPVLLFLPALPALVPGRAGWALFASCALLFSTAVTGRIPGFVMGLNLASVILTLAMLALFFLIALPRPTPRG